MIYQGMANFTVVPSGPVNLTCIMVATEEALFAVKLKQASLICGNRAYSTENPRLRILVKDGDLGFPFQAAPGDLMAINADLATYGNTKSMF